MRKPLDATAELLPPALGGRTFSSMTSPLPRPAAHHEAAPPEAARRSSGITVMAATIFVVSAFGLASAFVSTENVLGFEQPITWKALLAATSALGIWAASEAWRLTRRAERAYLLWCAVGTIAATYYVIVLAPRMIAIAAEIVGLAEPPRVTVVEWGTALAIHVALLALGWWYLRTALHRGSTPHEAGTPGP